MVTRKRYRPLVIWLGACLFLVSCGQVSYKDIIQFGPPRDVTFLDGVPAWRGLAVGKATRNDVLSLLGSPEARWSFGRLEVLRYLPDGYRRQRYDTNTYFKLVLEDGVLQVLTIKVWGYYYTELIDEFGSPERVVSYPHQDDVAVFADQGTTAVFGGSGLGKSVSFVQYYAPTTAEDYLQRWGQFHPEELPWPTSLPDRIDLLGFVPGKTKIDEIETILGVPDFQWADEKRRSVVYFYHVPGTISERVHKFAFERGTLIWMNVEVRDGDYVINDAIGTWGQVGVVIRPRYVDTVLPVQYYAWPEKGVVLVAARGGGVDPIDSRSSANSPSSQPSGADEVVAHVQFEPVSLDTFLKQRLYDRITDEIGDRY